MNRKERWKDIGKKLINNKGGKGGGKESEVSNEGEKEEVR